MRYFSIKRRYMWCWREVCRTLVYWRGRSKQRAGYAALQCCEV